MSSSYFSAAWTEASRFITCSHEHGSVAEAVSCIRCAGGYVVAVKMGLMRCLKAAEEAEFQSVRSQSDESQIRTISMPTEAVVEPRYAVMIRVKLGRRWCWRTWMCFDTYAEATTHTRQENRVVQFRSPEWNALRHQTEVDLPCASSMLPPNPPPQGEPESFIEFVLRLLSTHKLNDREAGPAIKTACIQSGQLQWTDEKRDKQQSTVDDRKNLDETSPELPDIFRIPLEGDVTDGQ